MDSIPFCLGRIIWSHIRAKRRWPRGYWLQDASGKKTKRTLNAESGNIPCHCNSLSLQLQPDLCSPQASISDGGEERFAMALSGDTMVETIQIGKTTQKTRKQIRKTFQTRGYEGLIWFQNIRGRDPKK